MTCSRFLQLSSSPLLSVFFTAGFPRLNDTVPIAQALQRAGVDIIEIGFPFSDPVADGPTIQESNIRALGNGMSMKALFQQLRSLRTSGLTIPVLMMGYLNPVEQYGCERFFEEAARCGVDGLIIPDMPFDEYSRRYRELYRRHSLKPVFLVTSRTEEPRIREFDREEPAFIYVLSSDAVTGGKAVVTGEREAFFKRLQAMHLSSRLMIGFGVSDRDSFSAVVRYSSGAIIGSAFLRSISDTRASGTECSSDVTELESNVKKFISGVR